MHGKLIPFAELPVGRYYGTGGGLNAKLDEQTILCLKSFPHVLDVSCLGPGRLVRPVELEFFDQYVGANISFDKVPQNYFFRAGSLLFVRVTDQFFWLRSRQVNEGPPASQIAIRPLIDLAISVSPFVG